MYSIDTQSKIHLWRQKVKDGTITPQEQKEAIEALRQDRVRAAATSSKARATKSATAAKKNINSDDLLAGLEDL